MTLNLVYDSLDVSDSNWVEKHFKDSLAYIQADKEADNVIKVLKARSTAVKKLAGKPAQWIFFASSGIPLMSIVKIEELMDEITSIASIYLNSDKQIEDKIIFLKGIESIIEQFPSSHFRHGFSQEDIDITRLAWLQGKSLKDIPNGNKIANDYFGFTIPWVFNAISKKYIQQENEEIANLFEEFGVLCELGLPSFWAAKIYLSGIKSRQAAKELSLIFKERLVNNNLHEILDIIIQNTTALKKREDCSAHTLRWIELLDNASSISKKTLFKIPNFSFRDKSLEIKSPVLYCKSFKNSYYLCNSDYTEKISISINETFPFNEIANIPGIYFENQDNIWKMRNKNPNYQISEY